MIKKKVRQWLIETIPTSQFLMSGLRVIFFVHGEDWRLWSLGGINKKDDVQTRNEGFPRIWFWKNLTPLDRMTGGKITSTCWMEEGSGGVLYPRRCEGEWKGSGRLGRRCSRPQRRAGSGWMGLGEIRGCMLADKELTVWDPAGNCLHSHFIKVYSIIHTFF